MKTAELKVIIDKHTTSLADFEAIWGAVNKYMQSHPSPMSVDQVCRWVKASERLPEIGMVILVKYFNTYQELYYKNNVWFVKGTNLVAYSECFSLQLEWLETLSTTPSVKADGWVSVEERLPEKGERVIVCTDNWVVACCYINIHGEWKMAYDSSLFHGKITHYQPLPAPPKQQ